MGTPEPVISLSLPDRLSQREQIEAVLQRTREKGEPLRVRIPFSLYDQDQTRGYTFIRDATWNLQLPIEQTSPETVERLIFTLGQCIVAIAREGTEGVLKRLGAVVEIEEISEEGSTP